MKLSPLCQLLLFLSLVSNVVALKFLFYNPMFGRSHVMYVGKLADLLAKSGHEVVSFQPINTRDFNETGLKVARNIQREPDFEMEVDMDIFGQNMWKAGGDIWNLLGQMDRMLGHFAKSCEHQLKDEQMMQRLRDEKFDFAFTEFFDVCGLAVFEKIGIKNYGAIIAGTLSNMFTSSFGIPSSLSFVPEMNSNAIPPLSFLVRMKNVMFDVMGHWMFMPKFTGQVAAVSKKYLRPDFDLHKRIQEASIVFVNVDEFLDFPRPISHKIHYIGGTGMQKPEKLAPKYEKIFEQSKRGVIYMSFGTVAKSHVMPDETKKAFLEAFNEFPDITFLWKYEVEDGIAKDYPNIITDKWWPQKDLLVHPKLLAFITHGGANSIIETATAGAPVIAIPIFGDQSRNALITEFRGFGIKLETTSLTKDKIVDAINKIVNNESYNKNAKELSRIIRSKPHSADETFVKYAEFAAKYDLHSKLDLYGRHLSFYTYYNLDVYAALFLIFLVILFVVFLLLRCVLRCGMRWCRKEKVD